MQDKEKIHKVRELILQGQHPEARKLLETINTKDPAIRVDAILLWLVVFDHVRENDKLLDVTSEGIEITTKTGNESVRSYLLARKACFLESERSAMVHRQKNLMLSANVFEWIGFSVARDKREYEQIVEKRKAVEVEIDSVIAEVTERAERGSDHYYRGQLFMAIGDFYSSRYLCDLLDFQRGGKTRSKIANIYFVRRWNLDKFLYDRVSRRKVRESQEKCIFYFEKAIAEFRLGGNKSEEGNAIYNLAVKLKTIYRFRMARQLLAKARVIAEEMHEKPLLRQIELLEKRIVDKNRNLHDYVTEMGLDMPQAKE
jgi:hypothetical protein